MISECVVFDELDEMKNILDCFHRLCMFSYWNIKNSFARNSLEKKFYSQKIFSMSAKREEKESLCILIT